MNVFQLLEVKKESKNENLQHKKNKSYFVLRKQFQIKLIQCYKLAIKTTDVCFSINWFTLIPLEIYFVIF